MEARYKLQSLQLRTFCRCFFRGLLHLTRSIRGSRALAIRGHGGRGPIQNHGVRIEFLGSAGDHKRLQ